MTASNVLYLPACNSLRVNLTPCACAVHSLKSGKGVADPSHMHTISELTNKSLLHFVED